MSPKRWSGQRRCVFWWRQLVHMTKRDLAAFQRVTFLEKYEGRWKKVFSSTVLEGANCKDARGNPCDEIWPCVRQARHRKGSLLYSNSHIGKPVQWSHSGVGGGPMQTSHSKLFNGFTIKNIREEVDGWPISLEWMKKGWDWKIYSCNELGSDWESNGQRVLLVPARQNWPIHHLVNLRQTCLCDGILRGSCWN